MVFPLVAVTWDTIFATLGVQNLYFDRPGASIFHPGAYQLEDIRGGHGRSHGGPEPDFKLFLMIWGAHSGSFLSSDGLNSVFFLSLFPSHFLHRFLGGIIDSWRSQNKVFARKVLQKPCFRKNRLLVIRGRIFGVFWRPWGVFF